MKNDVRIFSKLFIVTQMRNGDFDTFFSYENRGNPPSLACDGKIRSGAKAYLLPYLKMFATTESFVAANTSETQSICTTDSNDIGPAKPEGTKVNITEPENADGKVLEVSVLVNLPKPTKQSTFAEYARTVFVTKVTNELQTVEWVDIF